MTLAGWAKSEATPRSRAPRPTPSFRSARRTSSASSSPRASLGWRRTRRAPARSTPGWSRPRRPNVPPRSPSTCSTRTTSIPRSPRSALPRSDLMTTIHVAHSPDSDDAFMFYALAAGKIDTEGLTYVHELQDIESLNQRAMRGELEVTAVSIHAYAYLSDRYSLLPHGASMGDRYGPRLVAREPADRSDVKGKRVAIPGPLTSAYLALRLYEPDFQPVPT